MKQKIALFILLSFFHLSWSQKIEKFQFKFSSKNVEKILQDVETKFNVRYSYVDSVLSNKKISIPKKLYSIDEINLAIERQTILEIVKIDAHFYSITQKKAESSIIYKLESVLIEGFMSSGINKVNQKTLLTPSKIESLPGVTDTDLLLSLQQLPGVKSPNETATGLHIRGGTPDQNQIMWDGIRLYHSGHLFGMISGINPNIEQTVNYYNKGTSSKYGEKLSSIIDIKTTDNIAEKTKLNVGVNAINVDLYTKVPIYKKKIGLQLSARKSFTEKIQSPTFNQLAKKVFQNTNLNQFDDQNKFQFQDYSAKLNFKPNSKTQLSLSGIAIDNNLNFVTQKESNNINKQSMNILNYGFSLNWNQNYGSRFSHKLLLFYSAYDFDYEKKQELSSNKFEAFKKLNRVVDSGIEFNLLSLVNKDLNIEYGYQILGNDASHLFNNFNQEFGIDLSSKHFYNISHVLYANIKQKAKTWTFNFGARYIKFNKIDNQNFEPRIYIQKNINNSFIWQASYEKRSQILSQIRENFANDLSLENYVWVLSNNTDYPIQRSSQITTGFIFKKKKWLIDLDTYYKAFNGITSLTFGFQNQYDTNIRTGLGFTKGVDILLQMSTPKTRVWLTYTFQDSQNKFENINDDAFFQTNTNIKHSLNLSINQKWKNYSLTAGWFTHSGKPYGLLNESDGIATYNSENLPSYHHLDISSMYQIYKSNEKTLKIGFSIYNVYNNHKIISKEFQRRYLTQDDFDNPKYSIENYYSLGITPNIFMRLNI